MRDGWVVLGPWRIEGKNQPVVPIGEPRWPWPRPAGRVLIPGMVESLKSDSPHGWRIAGFASQLSLPG